MVAKNTEIVNRNYELREILWRKVRRGMYVWDPHPGRIKSIIIHSPYEAGDGRRARLKAVVHTNGQGDVSLYDVDIKWDDTTLVLFPRGSARVRRMDVQHRRHT